MVIRREFLENFAVSLKILWKPGFILAPENILQLLMKTTDNPYIRLGWRFLEVEKICISVFIETLSRSFFC